MNVMDQDEVDRWKTLAGACPVSSAATLLRLVESCTTGPQLAEFAVLLAEATFGCAIMSEMMKKHADADGARTAISRMALYREIILRVEAKLPLATP